MKLKLRIFLVACFSIGAMFAIASYVKTTRVSALAGCGIDRACAGNIVGTACFNGCAGVGNCSVFATQGKRCCRATIYYCPVTETRGIIRRCDGNGCAEGRSE